MRNELNIVDDKTSLNEKEKMNDTKKQVRREERRTQGRTDEETDNLGLCEPLISG